MPRAFYACGRDTSEMSEREVLRDGINRHICDSRRVVALQMACRKSVTVNSWKYEIYGKTRPFLVPVTASP